MSSPYTNLIDLSIYPAIGYTRNFSEFKNLIKHTQFAGLAFKKIGQIVGS